MNKFSFLMRKIGIILLIAVLYITMARLSQFLFTPGTLITPVWPPAGLALAAVLIFGNIALVGVFIGSYVSNFHMFISVGMTFSSVLFATIPGLGSALQAYVGKLALSVFTGADNIFKNIFSVLIFIFISAFAACAINASFGLTTLLLTGNILPTNVLRGWLTWWIADAVGVIVAASTIMSWYQLGVKKISWMEFLKLAATWSLILCVGYIILHFEIQLFFLLIPFAIWAAFQFDIRFSLLTGLLISSVCLYGSAYGHAIIQAGSVNASILLSQLFISIIFLIILLTHVILSQRQRAYLKLQALNIELEQRVTDRTKDLSESNKQLEIQKNHALKAYEALKQSHARLIQSEKMASLGLLTAGVAHEIKNPLNAISANIESIKQNMLKLFQFFNKNPANDTEKLELNSIHENNETLVTASHEGIKRATGIIADLSAFARADEPEMVKTDLNRNIDSTLNLLSSEIKRHISVIKEYGDIPLLRCHSGKINQVIMNILINAIHALQTQGDGKITIKTETKNGSIILSIKDNGPGIKKEVLEKLFTPFFTTKGEGFGSGLGLFISQNIIKEHYGTLIVNSELGKGTEFVITLPVEGR